MNGSGWMTPARAVRLDSMRRLVIIAAAVVVGVAIAAGCGYEGQTGATPETVEGSVPTSTTETTSTTPTTPGPTGDATAGKVVFVTNCGGCHTLSDAGTSGTVGPNLDDLKPDAARVSTQVINGGTVMPPFKGTLTDQQIADVAAYVSTAAGS